MKRTRDLIEAGAGAAEVRRVRKSDRLTWGVYLDDEDLTSEQRYLLKSREVQNRLAPGAALAGTSAAVAWELPLISSAPDEVFIRNITRGTYAKDVRVLPGSEVIEHNGHLTTPPAQTVMDCARLCDSKQALVIADAALAQGLCTVDDLRVAAEMAAGKPGASRMRWIAHNADPLAESPGETIARMMVMQLGYDVISQFHVTNGKREAYLDLLVAGTMIALEFNGMIKYKKRGLGKVIAEALREGDLQELGYQFVRLIWQQLALLEQLDKRLKAVGARPVRRRRLITW